jgi:hypothetical protein
VSFGRPFRACDPASGREVVNLSEPRGLLASSLAASVDGRHLWTSAFSPYGQQVPTEERDARTGAVQASAILPRTPLHLPARAPGRSPAAA